MVGEKFDRGSSRYVSGPLQIEFAVIKNAMKYPGRAQDASQSEKRAPKKCPKSEMRASMSRSRAAGDCREPFGTASDLVGNAGSCWEPPGNRRGVPARELRGAVGESLGVAGKSTVLYIFMISCKRSMQT